MIDPLSQWIHRAAGQHGPVMLMYHSIARGTGTPDWPWAVSRQRFCDQLDFLLAQGYATPTMGELSGAPHQWPGRTAVITFDDGYVDNLSAFEELQKRSMRATWFMVSGSIGQNPRWPDDGRPTQRLLNETELRLMAANGMEIGSHTVNHVRLPNLDDSDLIQELVTSKTTLQDIIGSEVRSFAYPYGVWDLRCALAVQRAGYASACTTQTGWSLRDNNAYRLRRLTVSNAVTTSMLARMLPFASNDVSWKTLSNHYLQQVKSRLGNSTT